MQLPLARRTIRSCSACLLVAWALSSCSDGATSPNGVAPLVGADGAAGAVTDTLTRPTSDLTTSTAPAAGSPDVDRPAALATVADTLGRYGAVLGELSADPTGAPAPGTAGRDRWDAVVLAGSPLSIELLERIRRRAVEDRVVVEPGPQGVSFRHVPVGVGATGPAAIEFSWCGWSPGIGRSLDTGEAVDEAVAHTSGTGLLVRIGDTWRLAALDQFELELLPPGSADPCPPVTDEGRP